MNTVQPPSLLTEQTRKAYNALAETYAREWVRNPDLGLADEFLSLMRKGSHLLDIGCGPGQYSSYFLDKGFSVEAIDVSSAMLHLVNERDPRVPTRKLDMSSLDFAENTFEGLWVCASLPHIPINTVPSVLKGFHHILKPEGVMLVNAIIGGLDYRIETAEEMGSGYEEEGRFFQWYPSADHFKAILDLAGFEIVSERHRMITSNVLEAASCRTNSWYNAFCRVKNR